MFSDFLVRFFLEPIIHIFKEFFGNHVVVTSISRTWKDVFFKSQLTGSVCLKSRHHPSCGRSHFCPRALPHDLLLVEDNQTRIPGFFRSDPQAADSQVIFETSNLGAQFRKTLWDKPPYQLTQTLWIMLHINSLYHLADIFKSFWCELIDIDTNKKSCSRSS